METNLVAVVKFNSKDKKEWNYKLGKHIKVVELKPGSIIYVSCTRKDKKISGRPAILIDIRPYNGNIEEITGTALKKVKTGTKVQLKDATCENIIEEITVKE